MTVKELILVLQSQPLDAQVFVDNKGVVREVLEDDVTLRDGIIDEDGEDVDGACVVLTPWS